MVGDLVDGRLDLGLSPGSSRLPLRWSTLVGDGGAVLGDLATGAKGDDDFLRVEPRLHPPNMSLMTAPPVSIPILSVVIVSNVTLSVSVVERRKCIPSITGVVRPPDEDLPRGVLLITGYGTLRVSIVFSPGSDEDCDG